MKLTKIYFLKDPLNQFKGYIGKSDNIQKRYKTHLFNSVLMKNTKKNNWLKDLKKQGLNPIMEEIDIVPTSEWNKRKNF